MGPLLLDEDRAVRVARHMTRMKTMR